MVGLLPKLKAKSSDKCESGIYIGCECQDVETVRSVYDYWTAWSTVILVIALVITLVSLYTGKTNKFFYVFLVFAASNSFAVALAAQILLETTDVLEQADLPTEGSCPATINETRFKELLLANTLVHILPIFGSLFITLSLSTSRIPSVFLGKSIYLILFAIGLWFFVSLIYNAIPSQGEVFFSKFERVYFQSDVGVLFSLPALYVLFAILVSLFVASKKTHCVPVKAR